MKRTFPHSIESRVIALAEDRWPTGASAAALDALVLASHLLGADRAIANIGGGNTSAKGVALGGSFRSLTHSFVGPDTVRALRGYRADRLVFAVKGITRDGHLTDAEPLEAEVKRGMMAHAKTVVLLATARKFLDRGRTVVGVAEDVDVAFVTTEASAEDAHALASQGVAVHRV